MVESSVSSIGRNAILGDAGQHIEVNTSTFFTHLEVLMIWLYSRVIVFIFKRKKTVNGFA